MSPFMLITALLAITPLAIVVLRRVDRLIHRRRQIAFLSGPLRDQVIEMATGVDADDLTPFPIPDADSDWLPTQPR